MAQFKPQYDRAEYNLTKRKTRIPMAISPRETFKIMHKLNKLNTMYKWQLSGLGSFLYLTGARISEALGVKVGDIEEKENNVFVISLKTLKSRVYPLRQIPIAPVRGDKPFFRIMKIFLGDKLAGEREDYLFPFPSRFVVNNHFKKIYTEKILQLDSIKKEWVEEKYRLHPHYFRHCRLSHLTGVFGFSELELMKFAGWSSTRPCIFYVKLSYKDILNKMYSPATIIDYLDKYMGGNLK